MKFFIALFFITLCVGLSAQLNPKDIYINAKEGEVVDVVLNTMAAPNVVVEPSAFEALSFDPIPGTGTTKFMFTPIDGFIGDESITIEYFVSAGFPGIVLPNYTTLHYRIKESKIDLANDYAVGAVGDSLLIDVLNNDTSSDGSLVLDRLGLVEGCSASVVGNSINVVLESSDLAFVRYFASDSTGNIEAGKLYIQSENESLIDDRMVYTDNQSSIYLHLNHDSYVLTNSPVGGFVNQNGHIAEYEPFLSFVGTDTLSFTNTNGGVITYVVEVLPKDVNNSFVQDDQIFVTTNGNISFNVFDNDFRDDFNIIDYSPELTYNGNGSFSFSPQPDFTGDLSFFYKIYAGFQFHTGTITVHVDDFAPNQVYDYDFTILKNHDLVVKHDTPASDYFFTLAVPPSNGTVIVLDINDNEILECDVINGENTVIYIPNADFNGLDEFDLEYCTVTGICEIVKVDINVLDSNHEDCLCLTSCVYEGDYNDDGIVNAKDALSLGLNIGEGGYARTEDFNLFWTGQSSNNWGHTQMNTHLDLKCGDADGNGYIDFADFNELENHYGNVHNFVPNNVGQLSNIPISFVPQSTDVDSGEWMFIDVFVGNASNPAVDFYGTSFTFNINPDVVDSSSVSFSLADQSWLAYESPLYDFYTVPQDGQVDIAVSRVSNTSTDGIGLIGTLEFIVEDEVGGFKRRSFDHSNSFQVAMSDIISVNEKGHFKKHPNQVETITLNASTEELTSELSQKINVFPNPTSSYFTIDSDNLNIDRVEVYDALGRNMISRNLSNTYNHIVDMSVYGQGIYFIKVYSQGGVITKKIQKIDL